MSASTRTTTVPGDRVTVVIQYTDQPMLKPLIGKLRTVEVTADLRVLIDDEDGHRHQSHGRIIPPVRLVEASIFTDSTTGQLWAEVYHLPPRDSSPRPLPQQYAAVVEPDGRGGIARMPSCNCGQGCVCLTCGQQTTYVAHRLEWIDFLPTGKIHNGPGCGPPLCAPCDETDGTDCCGMPMMLAPIGWVCRRDTTHRRPYLWPKPARTLPPPVGPRSAAVPTGY